MHMTFNSPSKNTTATLASSATIDIGDVTLLASTAEIGKLGAGTAEIGKLAAGTAAIGKLAANSGVDIGDVDVLSIATGANLIGKVGIDQTTPGTTDGVTVTNTTIDDYETVAASQTAQALGATGATGDYLSGVLVVPATTSPGNVIVLDNATSITVFTGGAGSVTSLVPFYIAFGAKSVSGAWKVTTGAAVSAIGFGKFT